MTPDKPLTDSDILDILARAAAVNCYHPYNFCTCGAVSEQLERVLPHLIERAKRMGIDVSYAVPDEPDIER